MDWGKDDGGILDVAEIGARKVKNAEWRMAYGQETSVAELARTK